jgi:hypothetical protein
MIQQHTASKTRKTPFLAQMALVLALAAALFWGLSATRDASAVMTQPPVPNGTRHITDVPPEAHRRAAQHLEEMRFSEMAPGWERAALGENVRFLYRPDDLQAPSYYEFPVVIPTMNYSPTGYIIVSAGPHDFPIAHWDFRGYAPTQILDQHSDNTAAQYFKLDTLAYAAEDAKGNLVATLGQLPPKIEGMQMAWLDQPQELTEETWVPDAPPPDDSGAENVTGTLVITGPAAPPPDLVIGEWSSWSAMKTGYAESYAVFLEEQKREASAEWDVEQAINTYGKNLDPGEIYQTPLFWVSPTIALTGEGSSYIQTETLTRENGLPPLYQITVDSGDVVPLGFTPFTMTVDYQEGPSEVVRFQIANLVRAYLPLTLIDASGSMSPTTWASAGIQADDAIDGSWGSWHYYWAGSHSNQRLYRQLDEDESPNTSGCVSGCGATAWAMLFGWADYQAANGNSYWAPRWGLYRSNGGYGSNAVAPSSMNTGIKNVTWEIRQYIDTFCAFGQGATAPWDMSDARHYLAGRTGTRLYTHYNAVGIHEGRLRRRARNSIRDRDTPAVIGTGWLNHYPLAYGYRWRSRRECFLFVCWTDYQRQFYVNQGWSGNGNGWVSAGTWFAGEIRP